VRPDVVHLHSASAGLTGRLVVRGRVATIFQPHGWSWQAVDGMYARAVRTWERLGARWAHLLVCVSDDERRNGERARVRGRFAVVPNGVDTTKFRPVDDAGQRAARGELGLSIQGPKAVCVGRLDRQKGQETVVRAWPAVRSARPDAELLLVGTGPRQAELRTLANDLRVGDAIHFAGDRSDVELWYAAADVFVFTSLWGEGMPLTPLEAMASGLPVIASDVASIRSIVSDERGAVVPAGDPVSLARQVVVRCAEPQRRAAEGRAARKYAEQELDIRRTHEAMAALTEELVANR
jgi:glycosyltransferase involved in cell wall biosynthesis